MDRKSYNLILSIFAALTAFIVYILTLPPTVWFIDSGELAAVATTLGIAHPTGYPLFTIVGHLFTKIPIGSEVYRINLMNAIFCSLGVLMIFYLFKYLLGLYTPDKIKNNVKPPKKSADKKNIIQEGPDLPQVIRVIIPTALSIILAFSGTYWFIVRLGKVNHIQVFLEISIMLVFFKAIFETKSQEKTDVSENFFGRNKYYLFFAFLLGLSFTNHMTTVLLIPACFTLFFTENYKDLKKTMQLLGAMALFFLTSLSLYLYLPIRAAQNPVLIWGNPVSLERFLWHVSGKQFSVWIFSAEGAVTLFIFLLLILLSLSIIGLKFKTLNPMFHFVFFIIIAATAYLFLSGTGFTTLFLKNASNSEIIVKQFKHFFSSLWTEFGDGVVLFAIPGVYRLSKYNKKVYYFTLLTFFTCVFYSVNYDIFDIDSYFLLAYITLVIWIGFGFLFIYEFLAAAIQKKGFVYIFSLVLLFVSFAGLKTHYENNDESKDYSVEEMTMNIFKNVEPGGIVVSSQWDFWVSASWYYKYVKNARPDIIVIDKELLRRSWYFTFIERNYPDIYNNSRAEIERFLADLYKFEHNIPYDTKTIMKDYADMLTSLVVNNPARKFYITWEIEQNKDELFAPNYARVPNGLLVQLVKPENMVNNSLPDYKTYDFQFTPTTNGDYYHKTLMNTYAGMLTRSAAYLLANNRIDEAKKYLDLALLALPNYSQAIDLKKKNNLQ